MIMREKFHALLISSLFVSFSFLGSAHADADKTFVSYQECRAKERIEVNQKIRQFEFWGGLLLWQGTSIPFKCDRDRGLEKTSYEDQLTKLLDRVILIPSPGVSNDFPEIRHSTCKLFASRRASRALSKVQMPTHLQVQTMIVDEIADGENFFLECFAGVGPYARGFSAQ